MKQMKWLFLSLLMVFSLAGLAACGEESSSDQSADQADQQQQDTEQQEQSEGNSEETEQEDTADDLAAVFPITVTDATGKEVTIESQPERIVSVMPSSTEIAFALGLGDKVVGVSDYDNYPKEVLELEKVGGLQLNFEKIVSLDPDLVLANTGNGQSIEKMRDLGLNVLVLGAQSLEGTFEDIRLTGKATGTAEQAEQVIEKMKDERDQVAEVVSSIPEDERKTVWIEVGQDLFSVGSGTFMNELVELAGGKNIMADQEGWPQVSEEEVIEKNPDVVLVTYAKFVEGDLVEIVKQRQNWQNITAIQENQIYSLDGDIATRPGPRITQVLQEIAESLYPEKFNQ